VIFSAKRLRLDGGEVPAWTPLPQAHEWPAFQRMLMRGDLVDVPDELLSQSIKRRAKTKGGKR
ncbi:MAG: hypothetical protein ACO32L_06715, partial [Aquiluna sp.]